MLEPQIKLPIVRQLRCILVEMYNVYSFSSLPRILLSANLLIDKKVWPMQSL
jgi:hypothetical protein